MDWQFKNLRNRQAKLEFLELQKMLSKKLSPDSFGKNVVHLEFENYIELEGDETDNMYINITKKGQSAYMSRYFLQKNHEILVNWLVSVVLALCNIGVLVTAIITITHSRENEIKNIQERLLLLEKRQMIKQPEYHRNLDSQINKKVTEKATSNPQTKKGLSTK